MRYNLDVMVLFIAATTKISDLVAHFAGHLFSMNEFSRD